MSPEQARGKALDKRTDIWAFGCCLYETLTGRAAFLGETVSDTLVRILEREPGWEALPDDTPPFVRLLLHRCLQNFPYEVKVYVGPSNARERLHELIASVACARVPSGRPNLEVSFGHADDDC